MPAFSYPVPPGAFGESAIADALRGVGLEHLLLVPYTNGQMLIKETRLKREADRRGKQPASWHKHLIGNLRKDRRTPH